MKRLSCKDLGPTECIFEFSGDNDEEIVNAILAHAAEHHPEKISRMTEEDKEIMTQKMKELLKNQ